MFLTTVSATSTVNPVRHQGINENAFEFQYKYETSPLASIDGDNFHALSRLLVDYVRYSLRVSKLKNKFLPFDMTPIILLNCHILGKDNKSRLDSV